ncbi:MAG: extracellular solute-binding protein [Verrucomicrobiota bacterium]|nr:extracellular solute-binding protein [Verrucomicrobiota bacterium]
MSARPSCPHPLPALLAIAPGLLILAASAAPARAGWIEDRADGSAVIHVRVFELPDPSRREPSQRADVAAVREFCRRFPERFAQRYREQYRRRPETYGRRNWDRVEVELHQYSGIKIGNLGGRVGIGNLLAVAGKVAPDVMYVNFRQSGTYINEGFLYPLDRPEDGYLTAMSEEEKAFRIHPKTWPVIRRRGPDGAKHVWAIPYGGALGKVVLFRKDLFDEAGLTYPDSEWTWADLRRLCRALTDPARGRYGLYLAQSQHEAAYWLAFLWSAGGEVLQPADGRDAWRAVFAGDAGAAALDFYTLLCAEPWTDRQGRKRHGYVWTDPALADAKWSRGEIGMQFSYIDEKLFAEINPDITGMVPAPRGPGGARGAELNSRMMGLFAGIEQPAVRDAAWEFIRFYDSEDAARIKTRIMVEGGFGPFLNPRDLARFGYEEMARFSPKGWKECFEAAIESSRPEPYARNCNAIYNLMTQPIREARNLAMRGDLPEGRDQRLAVMRTLLARSAQRVNEQLLGVMSPDALTRRRVGAAAALACIGAAFVVFLRRAAGQFAPPAAPGKKLRAWGFRKYAWAYLLLLPAALTILAWHYLPLARGLLIGFQDYKIMGESAWIGLDNFAGVLWNADWWLSVWNSARYSFLVIALTFLPPAILAVFLQEIPVGRMLFRTIYYLPAAVTSLVTVLLWKSFYDLDLASEDVISS